jgi:hypothetical protein
MAKWVGRLGIAVVLLGLTPRPAAAQFWDLIAWLNDMSGPQMIGAVFEQPLLCHYEEGTLTGPVGCAPLRLVTRDQGKGDAAFRDLTFGFRLGRLTNTKTIGNQRAGDISAVIFSPPFTAVRWSPKRTLDVSAALEFVRFQGPQVEDFWATTAHVAARIKPLAFKYPDRNIGQLLGVGLRYQQFFENFGGERFGAPGSFVSNKEAIYQLTVLVDLGALFGQ